MSRSFPTTTNRFGFLNEATNLIWSGFLAEAIGIKTTQLAGVAAAAGLRSSKSAFELGYSTLG